MQRCLELARLGAGYVAPNPMVGAVLVYQDQIIGEGWHQQYGEAHAEVNCINAVKDENKKFISSSTLYVSLEPCVHFGKTPPCADLIIQHKIPRVVIGCRDPFKEVDARLPARAGTDGNDAVGQGKGIEKLKAAGVELVVAVLEMEAKELNKRFFTFHIQHRPYIILKWAQTADGKMASLNPSAGGTLDSAVKRLLISNEYSNRLVHKWRSEEAAILVGTNTALLDDPELTTRLWPGPSPVRLVVDMDLKLPSALKIFNNVSPTIVFNRKIHSAEPELNTPSPFGERAGVSFYQVNHEVKLVRQILNALYQLKIQSVLVEGGAQLLQSFIDEGLWDETRIIKNEQLTFQQACLPTRQTQDNNGLNAPVLYNVEKVNEENMLSDMISIYKPKRS